MKIYSHPITLLLCCFAQVVDLLQTYQPVPRPIENVRPSRRQKTAAPDAGVQENDNPEKEPDDSDSPECPFLGLPTQMLVRIAGWLTLAEVVEFGRICRRMRHIAKAEALWNDVDLGRYAGLFPTAESFKKFTYFHLYKVTNLDVSALALHPKVLLQEILFGNGKV